MPGIMAAATAGGYQERIAQLSNPGLLLDWGNTGCYAGTGTTFTNLGSTGTTNNGTLVNGPVYSGAFGGIMTVDGTDDHIQLNNTFTLPRAGGTMMVWLRTHLGDSRPFTSYNSNAYQQFCNFGGTNGVDRGETNTNCNDWYASGGANDFGAYTNIWTCLIARTNSNLVTWFERGTRQHGGTYNEISCGGGPASGMVADFGAVMFGESTTYDGHFDGDYGVIAMWNTNLSDHQCQEAFGVYRHRYGV